MEPVKTYPAGNVIVCRFVFGDRVLTDTEDDAFIDDGTLPGDLTTVEPTAVKFDYTVNGGAATTLTGASITPTTVGDQTYYEVELAEAAAARIRWRGYGVDGSSNPVVASAWRTFVLE